MEAPYEGRHMGFRAYRDFLSAVPDEMRQLPVYIVQADQGGPWLDANVGWIQAAYAEIDIWNRNPGVQSVRTLALWRWGGDGSRSVCDKNELWEDFRLAMLREHTWTFRRPFAWGRGDQLLTLTSVAMVEAPESSLGTDDAGVDILLPYTLLTVERSAAVTSGNRIWWYVRETLTESVAREGWIAQETVGGDLQAYRVPDADEMRLTNAGKAPALRAGGRARTLDYVRMRLTPGTFDKSPEDIVTDVPSGVTVAVLAGPRFLEGLRWWLMRWHEDLQSSHTGWMAEYTQRGETLLVAVDNGTGPDSPVSFGPGDLAETLTMVRLRKSPGYMDKPDSDIVADIWQGTRVEILDGPMAADGLDWWRVRTEGLNGAVLRGWMAERSPDGDLLLGKLEVGPDPIFGIGDLAAIRHVPVRIRRTPGYVSKADDDVLGEFSPYRNVVIQGDAAQTDGLVWWRAGGIARYGEVIGWIAQRTPGGTLLVGEPDPLPGTDIPNAENGAYLGAPYPAQCGIGQLWGENPGFYARYSYDGVALLGHNGIDFLLAGGSPVLATDGGQVMKIGFEAGGYGSYVLLAHEWGESLYAHLASISVEYGRRIPRGSQVGVSGNSGASTGPHLHFSIRIYPYDEGDGWGGHSDPLPYLNPDTYLLPNYILDEHLQVHRAGLRPIFPRLAPSAMVEDRPGLERP